MRFATLIEMAAHFESGLMDPPTVAQRRLGSMSLQPGDPPALPADVGPSLRWGDGTERNLLASSPSRR